MVWDAEVWLANCFILTVLVSINAEIEISRGQQCKSGSSDIVLGHVSYVTCLNECKARDTCTGVSYHALADVCITHGDDAVDRSHAACRGFVYSGRLDWIEPQLSCGSIDCDVSRAACLGTDVCQYTDCPVPVQSHNGLLLHGNTRVPGANIAYRCERPLTLDGASSLSCLGSGVWSHPFPSCQSMTSQTTSSTTGSGNTQTTYGQTTLVTTTGSDTTASPVGTTTTGSDTTASPVGTTTTGSDTTSSTVGTTTTGSETTATTVGPTTTTTTEAPTFPPTTTSALTCDNGWILNQGSCYLVDDAYRNFDATQTFCATHGAMVAVPDTAAENTFIKAIFSGLFDYWVGIEFEPSTVNWITTDPSTQQLPYNDWHDDTVPSDPLANCAIYLHNLAYRWWSQSCAMASHALCEKPAT